jgi:hypothetical protein
LRSGSFTAEDAVPLDDLEARLRAGHWREVALPLATAVAHLAAVHLDEAGAARLATGQAVAVAGWRGSAAQDNVGPSGWCDAHAPQALPPSGTLGGAFGPGGRLLAVVRLDRAGDRPVWRPEKVLAG